MFEMGTGVASSLSSLDVMLVKIPPDYAISHSHSVTYICIRAFRAHSKFLRHLKFFLRINACASEGAPSKLNNVDCFLKTIGQAFDLLVSVS